METVYIYILYTKIVQDVYIATTDVYKIYIKCYHIPTNFCIYTFCIHN